MKTSEETLKRILTQIHMQGFFFFGPMKLSQRQAALKELTEKGFLTESLKVTPKGLEFSRA